MSVEFRQRTPGEYARLLWKRKLLILLPAVAISVAVAAVVLRLPNQYQSTTLLIVRPSVIPNGIVPKLSDDDLTVRINNIGQSVVSRTSLEPIIEQLNLYAVERQRGEPMDLLVDRMRKQDIAVEVNTSRNDITNAFSISYKYSDPALAQKVASALADKYVSAQITNDTAASGSIKSLLDDQVAQAKAELDAIERRRLQFMSARLGTLPSEMGGILGQLTGQRDEQKARITEVGRLRDQLASYNSQLGDISKLKQQEIETVVDNQTDPKSTPTWAALTSRENQLEAEMQDLTTRLRLKPKNPDVIAVQQQLDKVKQDKQELLDGQQANIVAKQARYGKFIDPRILTINNNIKLVQSELARQESLLNQTGASISQLEQRINQVPSSDVALQGIDNDYKSIKTKYDELVDKQRKADLADVVATNQQGEKIQVIDPASLPSKPIAGKRPVLLALGLALGLGLGLALAAAFEVPRLLTVQTVEDARHYTHLPVLVSVPELLTTREQRNLRARRLLFAGAGVVATVAAIPVLALALRASHILERLSA